ncbi:MAG: DUF3800 domain-containing protein [Candidatus Beckwithbacteria bacterium]|nr:DUF3800 domain-containing protein [Patescibacteria group bacterium]
MVRNKSQVNKKYLFGFMDETGLLHTPVTDRIFALGLLKLHHPSELHREIINFKNRKGFYEEFHFTNVNDRNWRLYAEFIKLCFDVYGCQFYSLIFDKKELDISKFFKGNHINAYNAYVAKLIAESLDKGEYIAVIADDVNTPKSDNFEKQVKDKVKYKTKRNALFGIIRVESHAVSEIQMTDVLLGLVGYAYKIKYGLIKGKKKGQLRLLKNLQQILKVGRLSDGVEKRVRGGGGFVVREFNPIGAKK